VRKKLHYHLIGIGGYRMSAIARVLHAQGDIVTGSDRQESERIRQLRDEGIKVAIGHCESNVDNADIVVYTAAVSADNPELIAARNRGILIIEGAELLGRLINPYKHRVAVAGTHGKTTTTAMINAILVHAGLDPTALPIGGDARPCEENVRIGSGQIAITEACEAYGSFFHLRPSIAVITNIDADHLDYYGTIEGVEEGFRRFVERVDTDGCIVGCWDDKRVRSVLRGCGRKIVSFGLSEAADLRAVGVDVSSPRPVYELDRRGEMLGKIELGVPGEQNVRNSLAAAAVAFELGVDVTDVQDALRSFRGTGRRFEVLYNDGQVMVVDDYAHHPTEISATLKAARSAYNNKRIIAVFQPHLYSRTQVLAEEFAETLLLADEVIVTSIYAAREQPIDGVSGENIVNGLRRRGFVNARYVPNKEALPDELANLTNKGDMVLVLGAGDIRCVAEELAGILVRKRCEESK